MIRRQIGADVLKLALHICHYPAKSSYLHKTCMSRLTILAFRPSGGGGFESRGFFFSGLS